MRLSLLILSIALAPVAAAQPPPPSGGEKKCATYAIANPDEKKREELGKQNYNAPPQGCCVDSSDIVAEQKASDEHLRQMKRREEVIPLQHQYEQELYYTDRFAKRREETCGKPPARIVDPNFGPTDMTDMAKKACKAIGLDCKPVKHW